MDESTTKSIVYRQLDTSADEPAVQVAEVIAELEGTTADKLDSTYRHIDHTLDHVFSNPPKPDAQMEITFSYEGYRVTVEQSGRAGFVKV